MQQFPGGTPQTPTMGPVEDTAEPQSPIRRSLFPPMTLAIAVALLLMAMVQFAAGGSQWQNGLLANETVNWALGAKVPTLIAHGEYWRLVTASFLHGSWMHLGLNLLGIWVVGRLTEAFYGPARMLAIFTLSSLLGVVVSYAASLSTSLGASTGVMGLVGAVIWHNWQYRKYLPPRMIFVYRLLLMLVLLQFMMDMQNETVDSFGHLGGFFGGVLLAMLMESRIAGPKQGEREWLPVGTAIATTAAVLLYGAVGLALALPGYMDLLRAGGAGSRGDRTAYMRQVVARRPYFTEGRLHLSYLLLTQGREQESRAEYLSALEANPSFSSSPYLEALLGQMAEFYVTSAAILDAAGRPADALEKYKRLIELGANDRTTALAHNNYAWLLVDRLNGDLADAERHAIKATSKIPDQPAYLDTLAWIYYKTERPEEALSIQLKAVELMSDVPALLRTPAVTAEMHYHLAAIYARLGKVTEARVQFKKSLEALPNYAPSREGLRELGEPEEIPLRKDGATRAAMPSSAPAEVPVRS